MAAMVLRVGAAVATVAAIAGAAQAAIDLEFRPVSGTYMVGQTIEVGLYAVSDSGGNQLMAATDVLFGWDTARLDLVGLDNTGGAGLISSAFPPIEPYGLNELSPPQDGDGYYQGLAFPGSPVSATPAGTLLTTFEFLALSQTPSTIIDLLPLAGVGGRTRVFDGTVPNLEVTGALVDGKVQIVPEPATLAMLILVGLASLRKR